MNIMEKIYSGIIKDVRTSEQIALDYLHSEIAAGVVLKWNRNMVEAPIYSIRNQDGSGSCVAQSVAKGLETLTGTIQSAHPIYARRINSPSVGMYLQNAGSILKHQGTTTEILDPSQNMNDVQMDVAINVPTPETDYLYIMINTFKNIDQIAEAIEMYKHCFITIDANYENYVNQEIPKVIPGASLNMEHCLTATYYFTSANGEKCLMVDESWGPDNLTKRIFTESYINAYATGAMYLIPLAEVSAPLVPQFTFSNPLHFGDSNFSVKTLQDILKVEGFFPLSVASTGQYGNITRVGVLAWQKKHNIATPAEIEALNGMTVGPETIAALNVIYGVK